MPYKDPEKRRKKAAEYSRKHYQKNKHIVKQRSASARISQRSMLRDMIRQYKTTHPCLDCGLQYPYYVMEFDHTRGTKHANVADLAARGVGISKLLEEMDKCEIVCANCHRERTWVRRFKPKEKDHD